MSDVVGLIFQEWSASLKSKDRSKAAVPSNFEELFEKLKNSGVPFEDAHALLPKAVKAHQPIAAVARNSYKKIKSVAKNFDKSEKEFVDEWNKSIEDVGTQTFFDIYPLPRLDEDNEPKQYGNMSAKEYKAQRKYADQFPVLDTSELEKRMRDQEYDLDIEDMLKTVLGDNNG
jgi:hypothetical protein